MLNYAKDLVKEFRAEQQEYLVKWNLYKDYSHLPWWKKIFVKKIEEPSFNRFIELPLSYIVVLRLYYYRGQEEIFLAVNDRGYGYKIDVFTGKKEGLLGSKGMDISSHAERHLTEWLNLTRAALDD